MSRAKDQVEQNYVARRGCPVACRNLSIPPTGVCTHFEVGDFFCKMHARIFASQKNAEAVSRSLASSAHHRLAAQTIEQRELQQVLQRSVEEDAEKAQRMQEARTLVYIRLMAKGLVHIPTEALGDCFFIALVETAGLLKTPFALRQEVCDYLQTNAAFFRDSFHGGEVGLQSHVRQMRVAGTWATAFEVTAASHLLLRPIHLITDELREDASTTRIEPPCCIAAEAWGPTVYLAHFLQLHFEGTRPGVPCPGGGPQSPELAAIEVKPTSSSSSSSSSTSYD